MFRRFVDTNQSFPLDVARRNLTGGGACSERAGMDGSALRPRHPRPEGEAVSAPTLLDEMERYDYGDKRWQLLMQYLRERESKTELPAATSIKHLEQDRDAERIANEAMRVGLEECEMLRRWLLAQDNTFIDQINESHRRIAYLEAELTKAREKLDNAYGRVRQVEANERFMQRKVDEYVHGRAYQKMTAALAEEREAHGISIKTNNELGRELEVERAKVAKLQEWSEVLKKELEIWKISAQERLTALDHVSGALCDAGDVVVEPYHEAIRELIRQRNELRSCKPYTPPTLTPYGKIEDLFPPVPEVTIKGSGVFIADREIYFSTYQPLLGTMALKFRRILQDLWPKPPEALGVKDLTEQRSEGVSRSQHEKRNEYPDGPRQPSAKEDSDFPSCLTCGIKYNPVSQICLPCLVRSAVESEREACAKTVEELPARSELAQALKSGAAFHIRARGEAQKTSVGSSSKTEQSEAANLEGHAGAPAEHLQNAGSNPADPIGDCSSDSGTNSDVVGGVNLLDEIRAEARLGGFTVHIPGGHVFECTDREYADEDAQRLRNCIRPILQRAYSAGVREGLERAAKECDSEYRACEGRLNSVQQMGHKGTNHKTGMQISSLCATRIRKLAGEG